MLTAHSLARRLRAPLRLSVDPSYRAALFVANDHKLIDPRGVRSSYHLDATATAETILCACAAGSGLTKAFGGFLATVRGSGLVARLAELLSSPEAIALSDIVFDADGRAIRVHREAEDLVSVSVAVEHFVGGTPFGRTFTLSGVALAEALKE